MVRRRRPFEVLAASFARSDAVNSDLPSSEVTSFAEMPALPSTNNPRNAEASWPEEARTASFFDPGPTRDSLVVYTASRPCDQPTTRKILGDSARSRSHPATSSGSGINATSAPSRSSPPRGQRALHGWSIRRHSDAHADPRRGEQARLARLEAVVRDHHGRGDVPAQGSDAQVAAKLERRTWRGRAGRCCNGRGGRRGCNGSRGGCNGSR